MLTEFAYCLRLKICLLERFAPGAVQARTKLLVPGVGQARAKCFVSKELAGHTPNHMLVALALGRI